MTPTELRLIAARASTIGERLAGGYIAADCGDEAQRQMAHRIAAWQHSAAADNARLFAARLAQDGLDETAVLPLLGEVRLAEETPLPAWVAALKWIAAALAQPPEPVDPPGGGEAAVPFEELLQPLVLAADQRLAQRAGATLTVDFAEGARGGLRRLLLRRLGAYCAKPLFWEFTAFRYGLVGPFSGAGARATGTGREAYDIFIADWHARSSAFLLARPVLARIIATIVLNWMDAAAEMAGRLAHDRGALAVAYAAGHDLGAVRSIDAGLSDPHRGGRAVAVLGFGYGLKLVYKPKDLRIDAAWADFLRWLTEAGAPASTRAPLVLARDGYGWAEFIGSADADGDCDGAEFYRRAGALLALLNLLQAADFHHENVIAANDCPVPVDLETLLHPRLRPLRAGYLPRDAAVKQAAERVWDSVLATRYLPQWVRRRGGGAIDVGGLGGPGRGAAPELFRQVNTDAMHFTPHSGDTPEGGVGASAAAEHGNEIAEGFAAMYRFLIRQRGTLTAADGPLHRFGGLRVRAVLAPTALYIGLLQRAAEPSNLIDGVDWSLQFEFLARNLLVGEATAAAWEIFAAERKALERLDVPLFTADTDSHWVDTCSGTRIADALVADPTDLVLARANALCEEDLGFNQRLIEAVLPPRPWSGAKRAAIVAERNDCQAFAETALNTAQRLGHVLADVAIRVDGSATWIGPEPLDHDHRPFSVVPSDLYSGNAGIALFLAGLAEATNDAKMRDLAVAAVRPLRALFAGADGGASAARLIGIGGASGVGSLIYALVRVGELLREPDLLAQAVEFARLIDQNLIAADRTYDAIGGAAGAAIALLTLYRATGDRVILEQAVLCGGHLLAARRRKGDTAAWATIAGSAATPTGMAHGTAGIALALLRLYAATEETSFRAGAIEAIAHERRLFNPVADGWPNCTGAAGGQTLCQWCYGAVGIGMSRLAILDLWDDPELLGEIEAALRTTLAAPRSAYDHVCCGDFARIEFLAAAGRRLRRPELIGAAEARAAERLAEREMRGSFALPPGGEVLNPGFFWGISGIGFTLLRLARPLALTNVLLWG